MRRSLSRWLALAVFIALPAAAQAPPSTTPPSPKPRPSLPPSIGRQPGMVDVYVVTAEFDALAPVTNAKGLTPEAQAILDKLRAIKHVSSRFYLVGNVLRQEILSDGFILPKGTVILHKAGDRYFAIVDDKAKTFLPVDAATVIAALEGGAGIENSQYDAKVTNTTEKRAIAGLPCRKSLIDVSYVSMVPFENEKIPVQGKNQIEIWHTAKLPSDAAQDQIFFNYNKDKTGRVRRAIATDIGFPMEVRFVVTQPGTKKAEGAQPGSFHMLVTDAKVEKMHEDLFAIPPKGYSRLQKNPYFGAAAGGH